MRRIIGWTLGVALVTAVTAAAPVSAHGNDARAGIGDVVTTDATVRATDDRKNLKRLVVTCSDGFTRTVSVHAAHGVAKALSNFNAHTHSGITCAVSSGAPRMPAAFQVTIHCTNGFQTRVSHRAVRGATRALDAFIARRRAGVSCATV